jgi:hypothetical protein
MVTNEKFNHEDMIPAAHGFSADIMREPHSPRRELLCTHISSQSSHRH